jgi:hypothetical protein
MAGSRLGGNWPLPSAESPAEIRLPHFRFDLAFFVDAMDSLRAVPSPFAEGKVPRANKRRAERRTQGARRHRAIGLPSLSLVLAEEILMDCPILIFAYFGPETVLPVTSMVATVVGLLMMCGRHAIRLVLRSGELVLSGPNRPKKSNHGLFAGPHKARNSLPERNRRSMSSQRADSRKKES